jgi:CheY-like chemotaxis protein
MPDNQSPKILIVDDDKSVRDSVKGFLEEAYKFVVLDAGSVAEAEEIIAQNADINLAIIDGDLGTGGDADEFVRTLLASSKIPIFRLSATPHKILPDARGKEVFTKGANVMYFYGRINEVALEDYKRRTLSNNDFEAGEYRF